MADVFSKSVEKLEPTVLSLLHGASFDDLSDFLPISAIKTNPVNESLIFIFRPEVGPDNILSLVFRLPISFAQKLTDNLFLLKR